MEGMKVVNIQDHQKAGNNEAPEPFIHSDVDLRNIPYMPMYVARFCDSAFSATVDPAAGFFAIQLWCKSWHQLPAGSLPGNEAELRALSGCGRDQQLWESVREGALYGWVLCSDGRYYHDALANIVMESYGKLLKNRENGKKGGRPPNNPNKTGAKPKDKPNKPTNNPPVNPSVSDGQPTVNQGKGREGNRIEDTPLTPQGVDDGELTEGEVDGKQKRLSPDEKLKALIEECDLKSVPPGYIFAFAQYRRDDIKSPLKSTRGIQAQINLLDKFADKAAMKAAIQRSMDNEWMRIVVSDDKPTGGGKSWDDGGDSAYVDDAIRELNMTKGNGNGVATA